MENNQLVISLESYNRLRDFYKAVKRNDVIKVQLRGYTYTGDKETVTFLSKDKAVAEVAEENRELTDRLRSSKKTTRLFNEKNRRLLNNEMALNGELRKLNEFMEKYHPKAKEVSVTDSEILKKVHKMSVREFKKWRKK